jgi:hypothetical protein
MDDYSKLKTALGISSRSLVHHWDKAGAPGQIPGYATHVSATSRAAQYMQAGGYIGIGIGGVSSLLAIQGVCSGDLGAAAPQYLSRLKASSDSAINAHWPKATAAPTASSRH